MAGLTALNNIVRQRAAFGGIMGRDGRRQYGGGSDMGKDKDSTDKSKGGYQGGPQGGYGDAGSDDNPSGNRYETSRNEFEYEVGKKALKRSGDTTHLKNKTIPDGSSLYYTGVPKSNTPYFGKYLNMTAPFRNNMLRKNIDYFLSSERTNLDRNKYPDTIQGYKDYMSDRLSGAIDASGNTIYNTENNVSTSFGPPQADAGILPVVDEDEIEFTYRMGDGQNVGDDVTQGYYAANGGRVPRNMGGIMGVVPRQGYFLGKIVKGVGKAIGGVADAAGKVLKSDLGKAAVLAAGYYYGGGNLFGLQRAGASGFGTTGIFSGLKGKVAGSDFFSKMLMNKDKTGFNPFKVAGFLSPLLSFTDLAKAKQDPSLMSTRKDTGLIDPLTGEEGTPQSMRENIELAKQEAAGDPIKLAQLNQKYNNMLFTNLPYENYATYAANGGRIGKAEGGLMDLGGMEKDYRAEGGFVPIGKQEKADDVPARLSVNEFVFTADAVRNAGGGDIDKGAEVMENMMKNLENGGRVSEESQGNTGAQEMFSVSERIGEVI